MPESVRASQRAEWDRARLVLVCAPAVETLFATLNTDAFNFLRPFDPARARAQHAALRSTLESRAITVVDVREVLAAGDRARLRDAAGRALVYVADESVSPADREALDRLHERTIDALGPGALADLVMLRPAVHVRTNADARDATSRFSADFEVRPAGNSYFMRDPMITTAAGVVVGRFDLAVRRPENDVAELVLAQLGITPLLRVAAPGRVEGGDFLPAGRFCLQGQGFLTNEDGVGQLLDAGAYGDVEVGVVRDPRGGMDEMHLDTYLALYDTDLAGICEDRTGDAEPEVDVWVPDETRAGRRYRRTRTTTLLAYLAEHGMDVVTFTKDEQEQFAANGLLAGPRDYLVPAQAGPAFVDRLRARDVRVETVDVDELTSGYGGPHCATQVLWREPAR
ncbi:MAG TPA: arginine deiminase family protein [Acidimicrobiia bacterium]|nr:arginine deiminase family protein [Acidimicrobiia bacterium]